MIIIEHIEEITKHLSKHSAHALVYKVLSDNDMAHILFQLQADFWKETNK